MNLRTRRSATIVTLCTMALAVMLPTVALAAEHDTEGPALDEDGKIWVCKYVGTPGEDERLKPGNDGLVIVSPDTLRNVEGVDHTDVRIGDEWTDAQELSRVIAPGGTCPGDETEDEDEVVDPEVAVTLAKVWTGDTDEVDFDFSALDPGVGLTIGDTIHGVGDVLSVDPDTTLSVTAETVSGVLPEGCTFEAVDLEHTTAALADWTADQQAAGLREETFTITNVVTCPEVEDDNDEVEDLTLTLNKSWDPVDDEDELFNADDVEVTFTVNGTDVADGATIDATPGDELTITESVTGFPAACDFDAIGFEDGQLVHTVGEDDDTITITNAVTCPAVRGIVIDRPDDGRDTDPDVVVVERDVTVAEDDPAVLGVTLDADDDGEVEVLGVSEERAAADELPRTGATTTDLLVASLLTLLFGTGLLLATRREATVGAPATEAVASGPAPGLWTAHGSAGNTPGARLAWSRSQGRTAPG